MNEDFSGGALPGNLSVVLGAGVVIGGALHLNSGCLQLARPDGSAVFSRSLGLSITLDISIQNTAQGDFNIWGLHDNNFPANCLFGPANGYGAGFFPSGSDNPNDVITRFSGNIPAFLSTLAASIPGSTTVRVRQEFLPNGVIRTFINNVPGKPPLTPSTRAADSP